MSQPIFTDRFTPHSRRGTVMTELIVAATLLLTSLSLLGTVSFRTGKLWQETRHYELALDELTNQLERLTALDESELDKQLTELTVSEPVQNALPRTRISGHTIVDDDGTRVILEMQWERLGKAEPLTLVGWITPVEGLP